MQPASEGVFLSKKLFDSYKENKNKELNHEFDDINYREADEVHSDNFEGDLDLSDNENPKNV
jgi:hypothetical protein